MRRLLMVTTVPVTLRAFLLPLAERMRARGWGVDAMADGASSCEDCRRAFDRLWDVKWSRNPLDPRNFVFAPGAVRRAVAGGGYDLVHVHTPVAAFVTRFALRRGGSKLVYTAHGFHFHPAGSPLKNAVFGGLEALAGRWTDRLVVINREDEAAARARRLVPPERLAYMPGIGVDVDALDPVRIDPVAVGAVRASLGVPEDAPMLSMVAEFIPRKRHMDALEGFAGARWPGAVLVFAGEGPLRPAVEARARELGVGDAVRFAGQRRDVPLLLRGSRLSLLPSSQEGLPRSLLESLSLEVPAVGASVRGIRELLEDGCGELVPVGNPTAVAAAVRRLLADPARAARMGKAGRDKVRRAYGLERILAEHERLYEEVLA